MIHGGARHAPRRGHLLELHLTQRTLKAVFLKLSLILKVFLYHWDLIYHKVFLLKVFLHHWALIYHKVFLSIKIFPSLGRDFLLKTLREYKDGTEGAGGILRRRSDLTPSSLKPNSGRKRPTSGMGNPMGTGGELWSETTSLVACRRLARSRSGLRSTAGWRSRPRTSLPSRRTCKRTQ